MMSTPPPAGEPAAPVEGPAAPVAELPDPAPGPADAGVGPVAWALRLRRIALGLLLLGAFGLVAVITMAAQLPSGMNGDYSASRAQYPPVKGQVEVTIEDQTALGLFFNGSGARGAPDGTCEVTGPQGEKLRQVDGPFQDPYIGGTEYVANMGFETAGPGRYTVTCTESGYFAGPAYRPGEPAPVLLSEVRAGALLVVGSALLLSALLALPLLLAALIVRCVQGRREETRSRRRRERGLALAVVSGLGALGLILLDGITFLAALLDPEADSANGEPLTTVLLTLPVLALLLVLVVAGALRRRGGRRATRTSLDLTVP